MLAILFRHAIIARSSYIFLYIIVALVTLSSIRAVNVRGLEGGDGYVRAAVFVVELFVTLALVRRANLKSYMSGAAIVLVAGTLLYVAAASRGAITQEWGRYTYFNDASPNLGAEIIAMSIVVASCSFSPIWLALAAAPSIYAVNLLQGRAALIVVVVVVAMRLIMSELRPFVAPAGAVALAALAYSGHLAPALNSALMLQDQERGMSTGFTGRDQYWGNAIKCFLDSPFIGSGVGANVEAHNFFLYGLCQFGALSILIFGTLFVMFMKLAASGQKEMFGMLALPILFIFNDRFINLNPYPFLMYVILFAHDNEQPSAIP